MRNDDEVNIVLKTIALIPEQTFKSMSRTNSPVNVDTVMEGEELTGPGIDVDNTAFLGKWEGKGEGVSRRS